VASFAGIKMQENQGSIPDTMGTVGPSHFMVVLNDGVAAYNKYTGVRRSPTPPTTSADFFRVTVSSGPYAGTYPTASSASDPRILYDHDPVSQRWVASALDVGSRHVLLAVSNGPDPVGNGGSTWVANNWTKYLVPLGGSCGTDYDTLGVDSNAIYIGIRQSSCEPNTMKLAALPKSPLLDGSAQTVQGNFILEISGYGSPKLFPAVNFDPITIDDPAWFLFGQVNQIYYNRLR